MYKVLFVDDDSVTRMICSNMPQWGEYGFEVAFCAENGERALKILAENKVDVVFTDIRMPKIGGLDLLKKIRETTPDIFVVLLSSYKEFEYAREGLKYGAVDYMIKPIDSAALSETLGRVRLCLDEQTTDGYRKSAVDEYFSKFDLSDGFSAKVYRLFCNEEDIAAVTLERAAEALGFSRDYFGKMVKQRFNINFGKMLTSIKMKYSTFLLAKTAMHIYEISECLGYGSPDYFTSVFKHEYGLSPADFKKTADF